MENSISYSTLIDQETCATSKTMAANYEMLKSEKDRDMLHFHGYLYWRNNSKRNYRGEERVYYKCIYCYKGNDNNVTSKCSGKAVLFNGDASVTAAHNHAADPNVVELLRVQGNVARQAIHNPQQIPRNIGAAAIEQAPAFVRPLINLENIGRNIRNRRHHNNVEPANPATLVHLHIPDRYRIRKDEIFLKHDGWATPINRVLIFSTDKCLDILSDSSKWGADGTFDVVPLLFDSLWIIFARFSHSYVPMVYILMNSRQQSSYQYALDQLRILRPTANPTSVAMDYEMAEINSFRATFPNVDLRLCFFHLSQSIYRHLCKEGFQVRYGEDGDFRITATMIAALAFVPETDIILAFTILYDRIKKLIPELLVIMDYFEENYIGRTIGRNDRRKNPRYPPATWSVYLLVLEGEPRTNNGIEAFNNQISRGVAASHPTIWKIIDAFKKEITIAEQKVDAFRAGGDPPRRKRTYIANNNALKNVVNSYATMPIYDYLRSIAHNLRLH